MNYTPNGKKFHFLKYVCEATNQDNFDSDVIAQELCLEVHEVNKIIDDLVEAGEGKSFSDRDLDRRHAIAFKKTRKTMDAYRSK